MTTAAEVHPTNTAAATAADTTPPAEISTAGSGAAPPAAAQPSRSEPKDELNEKLTAAPAAAAAPAVSNAEAPAPDAESTAATTTPVTVPAVAAPTPAAAASEDGEKQQKPPRPSVETKQPAKNDGIDDVNPHDFAGEVTSNNDLPSAATLRKIENYTVLDRHGKSHTFRSLYTGRNVARRVLVIFVRHFFCGNCQEYLRTLSASITPESLLRLPISTFITVVGCGDPGLIDMYVRETACPFPVYADPTRRLYDELGMVRTLALGQRPAYMRKSMLLSVLSSVAQGLRQVPTGKVTKSGDHRQIGGEFLFEPLTVHTPGPAEDDLDRRIGEHQSHGTSVTRQVVADRLSVRDAEVGSLKEAGGGAGGGGVNNSAGATATTATTATTTTMATPSNGTAASPPRGTSLDAGSSPRTSLGPTPETAPVHQDDEDADEGFVESKQVTWCHRMRTTRDHAEIPELMEVLGLDGQGMPIKDKKRWSRALETRKGTGLSMASQMSAMSASRASASVKSGADSDGVVVGPAPTPAAVGGTA